MKPNFFIVGAPKSGTTSLHNYLSQHPEIYMPKYKEINFFAKDHIKEELENSGNFLNKFSLIPKDVNEYLNYFKKINNEKIAGECTPWYMTSDVDAKEIYNFNPNSKIILIIREPVEMLYSLHSQLLFVDIEKEEDFQKALKLEEFRKNTEYKTYYRKSYLYYSYYITYKKHIEKYHKIFSKNLHIILFDNLKNNFNVTFKKLLSFLDVDPSFKPSFEILNQNKIAKIKFLQNPYIKTPITKIIPKLLRPFLSSIYKKLNSKDMLREPLPSAVVRNLKKQFLPEVESINKYFDEDLISLWNYDKT